MKENFKPMLATLWDRESCTFPKCASTKLDGIRCIVSDGKLHARSLKPIRNKQLIEHFQDIINASLERGIQFDGEIYSHTVPFGEIQSICNSLDKPVPEGIFYYAFDLVKDLPFIERYGELCGTSFGLSNFQVVEQTFIDSLAEVDALYEKRLAEGHEGLILRDLNSPYKFGRSTVKEGWMLKVKPFETFDSQVIGIEERMENTNESQVNELGQKFKRDTKEDKKPTGIAANLLAEYEGNPVKVVLTGDEDFRREIWQNREQYIGRWFEWKGMLVGAKNVPRHPNFIRFRDDK